jgi:hypothetical protein
MDEGDLLKFQRQFNEPVFASSFFLEMFDTALINFCYDETDQWTNENTAILRWYPTMISLTYLLTYLLENSLVHSLT